MSVQSALYRLRNLRLITENELEQLKAQDEQGDSKEIARLLGLPEFDAAEHGSEFTRRSLGWHLRRCDGKRSARRSSWDLPAWFTSRRQTLCLSLNAQVWMNMKLTMFLLPRSSQIWG